MLESGYELVHTVTEYWDRPRKGIADFEGRPHFYDCEFDEAMDEWSDTYRLSPVPDDVLAPALEAGEISRRWEIAWHQGRPDARTVSVLAEDTERAEELRVVLEGRLRVDGWQFVRALGDFKRRDEPGTIGIGQRLFQVRWKRF